ncbi:MAG: extracellular solute-binding protein [Chloroflexi bacterium]|nr:extracellular solute-binding protein [Chloroflexota bacterium]
MGIRVTRRRLLAGVSAGVAAGLLRLCQPDDAPVAVAAPLVPARQVSPAQTPSVVTIHWLLPADLGLERDFALSFIQQFNRQTDDLEIEATFEPWATYPAALAAALTSDAPPDLVHLGAEIVQEHGLHGLLTDLLPRMRQTGPAPEAFFPYLVEQMTDFRTRSRVWAVPKEGHLYVVYCNKELFDRAGVPYPRPGWTLEEFREAARRLTLDENGNPVTSPRFNPRRIACWGMDWGSSGADAPLPGLDHWQMLAWAQAGPWFSDDLRRGQLADPDHIAFVRQIVEMRCQDRVIPGVEVRLPDDNGDRWRQGQVAMCIAHYAQTYFYERERRRFDYDIVPAPAGPRGQFAAGTGSGWAIPSRSTQPDAAWALLRFLVAPAQQLPVVRAKRWGAALISTAEALQPENGVPAGFRAALLDPLFGRSAVQVRPIRYPPYLEQMAQIWRGEFGDLFSCSPVDLAEALRRAEPRIQALLDRAWTV